MIHSLPKVSVESRRQTLLHTWTRQLVYHPHVHFVVAQGGLTPKGGWVRSKSVDYFLPHKLLSVRMRMSMEQALRKRDAALHQSIAPGLWREAWIVHIKAAGSGQHAIDYLSRYVAQTALSSKRILADDGQRLTMAYTESGSGLSKTVRLTAMEFIRRFLQHVLPCGFKRIRYYGWLSAAARKRLERIRALLDWRAPDPESQEQHGRPLCPRCQSAWQLLSIWRRGRSPPPRFRLAQALYPHAA